MSLKKISRREMLKGLSLAVAGTTLAACVPVVEEVAVTEEPTEEAPPEEVVTEEPVKEAPQEEAATLEFWLFWCAEEGKKNYFDIIDATFQEANPNIKINRTCYDKGPLNDALRTAFQAGQPGDLFYMDPYPYHNMQWDQGGWLLNLMDHVDTDNYTALGLDVMSYDDKLLGVPLEMGLMAYWYSREYFDELGFEIPEDRRITIEQFEDICEKLTEAGISPLAAMCADQASGGYCSSTQWYLDTIAFSLLGPEKGRQLSYEKTIGWDDPDVRQAFEIWQSWFDKGFFDTSALGLDWVGMHSKFLQNGTGILWSGSWSYGFRESVGGWSPDFEMDFFLFPTIEGGKGNDSIEVMIGGTIAAAQATKHPEAVYNYMSYLASPESAALWVENTQVLCGVKGGEIAQGIPDELLDQLRLTRDTPEDKQALPFAWVYLSGHENDVWNNKVGPAMLQDQASIDDVIDMLMDARAADEAEAG